MKAYPLNLDYTVAENGDVFRVRGGRAKAGRPWHVAWYIKDNGYKAINIDCTVRYVHRVLAETFIPNAENKPYVAHKDGNKLNNDLDNLYWASALENSADAARHGTRIRGARVGTAKLTEDAVAEIKRILHKRTRRSWPTQQDIADHFGVTRECISQIAQGKNWRHAD